MDSHPGEPCCTPHGRECHTRQIKKDDGECGGINPIAPERKKRVGGSPAGTDPGIEVIAVPGILKYNQPDTVK
jgi:hypothetical protein